MNTVEKGDEFEEISFNIIEEVLHNKDLGIIPEQCEVFKKKKYYSSERKSDIIFDLSIEVRPSESEKPVLIYLIECKDYSHKIPVNEVEEFHRKASQIKDSQIKTVFITSNTFQSGAYNFANSNNMMLICVNESLSHSIILHKTKRFNEKRQESEFVKHFNSVLPQHVLEKNNLRKIKRVIEKEILNAFTKHVKSSNTVLEIENSSVISKNYIEEIVERFLSFYYSFIGRSNSIINLDELFHYLQQVFDLTITYESISDLDDSDRKILSKCSFVNKEIIIDFSLKGTKRLKFVVMHEIGHYFLHDKVLLNQNAYESTEDSEYSFSLNRHILEDKRHWIEWQANHFASCLLMPKNMFSKHFAEAKYDENLDPRKPLYVDDQRANIETFNRIINRLSKKYDTTKTSVLIRLRDLGWLIENYDFQHIGVEINNLLD